MTPTLIDQTKRWLEAVVIGHNFCPFAKKEFDQNKIHYQVINSDQISVCLEALISECQRLDNTDQLTTTLLILPDFNKDFDQFLDLLAIAEALLVENHYEGIYQVASFHPEYCFAGEEQNDPANYTNRSPYPMLHLIREDLLEIALKNFPEPENIPLRNIELSRKLGIDQLRKTLTDCMKP